MKPKTDRGNIVRFCLLWALLVAWGSAIASPKTLPRFPIWPTFEYGLGKPKGNREIQKLGPTDELFLWRVDGENSTVYLMGSIHLLKKSNYPLAPLYEYAYNQCDKLVVESHDAVSESELADIVTLKGNKKLNQYISSQTYKWIQDFAIDNDLDKNLFDYFIPDYVIQRIVYLKSENLGIKVANGVDWHFTDKAESDLKPIFGLEGKERYDKKFSDSVSEQGKKLDLFVNELKKGGFEKEINALVNAWINLDFNFVAQSVDRRQKNDINEYNNLLRDRNIAWIPEIEKYINQNKVTLIIAGSAHYFGEHSVLKLLEAKGYKIKQLYDVDVPEISFSESIKSDNLTAVKTYIQIHPNLDNYYYDSTAPEGSAYTPLHTAVKNGKLESVKLLVNAGVNINYPTSTGATPIYLAAQQGHLEILKYIYSKGGIINIASDDGATPLHAAAYFSQSPETMSYLLSVGALIDAKDEGDWTALHWAAQDDKNIEVLKFLIRKNASIDAREDDGWTALHLASSFGAIETVKHLIKNNASIDAKNNTGKTPLYWAIRKGNYDIADYLIQSGANLESKDSDGRTALHSYINFDRIEAAQYILDKGADINAQEIDGFTPLHYAVATQGTIVKFTKEDLVLYDTVGELLLNIDKYAYNPTVKFLIDNGADIEATTGRVKLTPLSVAVSRSYYGNAIELIDLGANVNAITRVSTTESLVEIESGYSPLMIAVERKDLSMVKILAENGADINYISSNNKTAISIALSEEFSEIAEYLKEKNNPKKTLIQAASDNDIISLRKHIAAKTDLDEKGAENWTALHYSAFYGFTEFSEILINNGASIDAKNQNEWTALHLATQNNHLGVVEILINNGASIDAKQKDGSTPLQIASGKGHLEVVKFLINNNASVDAKDADGWTALHIAAQEGQLAVLKLLINNKATIDIKNNRGFTPLYWAIREGHYGVADYLIENGTNIDIPIELEGEVQTMLESFSAFNRVEAVKYSLNNGADVNARSSRGSTSLHAAAQNGHTAVIRILIENGATINLRNNAGETALDIAIRKNHTEIQKILEGGALKISAFKYTGQFQFDINGMKGATFLIEASTDLKLWAPVGEFKNRDGVVKFSDRTSPLFDQQFYRVKIVE